MLSSLGLRRRPLDRLVHGANADNIGAQIAAVREHAEGILDSRAADAIASAPNAPTDSHAWRLVTNLVAAAVLASPAFAEQIEAVLAKHLPGAPS
jgi:hypothetical protein